MSLKIVYLPFETPPHATEMITDEIPSKFISKKEAACPCCGQAVLFHPTIKLFNLARTKFGKPLTVNAFYRCAKHQEELREQGYKAAKISPHEYGCALDIALPTGTDTKALIQVFSAAAKELGYKAPRFGDKTYGYKFLHVDLAFMLTPNPVPTAWQPGVRW